MESTSIISGPTNDATSSNIYLTKNEINTNKQKIKTSKYPFPHIFEFKGSVSNWVNLDKVMLIGSPKELGSWKIESAIPMIKVNEDSDVWSVQLKLFEGFHYFTIIYTLKGSDTLYAVYSDDCVHCIQESGSPRRVYPIHKITQRENKTFTDFESKRDGIIKKMEEKREADLEAKRKIASERKKERLIEMKRQELLWKEEQKKKKEQFEQFKADRRKKNEEEKRERLMRKKKRAVQREVDDFCASNDDWVEWGDKTKQRNVETWCRNDKSMLLYKKYDMKKNKRQKHQFDKDRKDLVKKRKQGFNINHSRNLLFHL